MFVKREFCSENDTQVKSHTDPNSKKKYPNAWKREIKANDVFMDDPRETDLIIPYVNRMPQENYSPIGPE